MVHHSRGVPRAAGSEKAVFHSLVWLIKCAQHVLSAGQKLPPHSSQEFDHCCK